MYETYYLPKLVTPPDDLIDRECQRCGESIDKELIENEKFVAEFEEPEKGEDGDGWRITHLRADCPGVTIRNSNDAFGMLRISI